MSKVLCVVANPSDSQNSKSRQLMDYFLEEYKKNNPQDEIEILDLYKEEIPHLDFTILDGLKTDSDGSYKHSKYIDQFVAADKYIFATPVWNFITPSIFISYISLICIAGKTFTYTATGPIGLLQNKKALHIAARGGFTDPDKDYTKLHTQQVLEFIGVKNATYVSIDGTGISSLDQEKTLSDAKEKLKNICNHF